MKNHLKIILSLLITFLMAVMILSGCRDSQQVDKEGIQIGVNDIMSDNSLSEKERLGKLLFFNESLSTPPGQACSECHAPEVAFADPDKELPVSRGAVQGMYGNRNDMTVVDKLVILSYASLFTDVYGPDALSDPGKAFGHMADALEAYERSSEVNPFNSKFDHWINGETKLTDQVIEGLVAFLGTLTDGWDETTR